MIATAAGDGTFKSKSVGHKKTLLTCQGSGCERTYLTSRKSYTCNPCRRKKSNQENWTLRTCSGAECQKTHRGPEDVQYTCRPCRSKQRGCHMRECDTCGEKKWCMGPPNKSRRCTGCRSDEKLLERVLAESAKLRDDLSEDAMDVDTYVHGREPEKEHAELPQQEPDTTFQNFLALENFLALAPEHGEADIGPGHESSVAISVPGQHVHGHADISTDRCTSPVDPIDLWDAEFQRLVNSSAY